MFTTWFYDKHLTFNRQDKDVLKKQIKAAYEAGLDGNQKIEANDQAKAKVAANISALERTLSMFPDLSTNTDLVKLINASLVQERKWLAHWEKCIAQTKLGYERLVAAAAQIKAEAFAAGSLSKEKEIKAQRDAERAANVRAQQEKQQQQQQNNKQQQNQNNNDQKRGGDGQRNDKNNDKGGGNNDKGRVLVVDKMIVSSVVRDGKDKKKKKDKGDQPQMFSIKTH